MFIITIKSLCFRSLIVSETVSITCTVQLYYPIVSETFVVQLKINHIFVFDTFLPLDPIYDFYLLIDLTG